MAPGYYNFLLRLATFDLILSLMINLVWSASIRYEQGQYGDYNVQIHLKNIELYAFLDDGLLNSEYDYDYTELTEKPSSTPSSTSTVVISSTSPPTTTSRIISENFNVFISNQSSGSTESSKATVATDTQVLRKCAPGYYRDQSGRCRRIRKPHIPFMQMVHTPGVIKSFQQSESNAQSNKMNKTTNV